jgi:predicted RNA-binding Zn-ribbon protein involved in translation (DUF1610 family)
MTSASEICKECGFDRKTGHSVGHAATEAIEAAAGVPRAKRAAKPCTKCGYDLTGLKTGTCPECGTFNIRRMNPRETERQTLRKMFVQPLLMIGIGLAIAMVVYGLGSGLGGAVNYLMYYALSVPIGFAAYVGCSMVFIGFDEPLGVTFVRLAGVYAVTDACASALGFVPFVSWITWPIQAFIYLGLLMQVMELDLEDAWLVAAITFVVHVVAVLLLGWIWATYF